jgi:outer membrane protein assembly factor BamA
LIPGKNNYLFFGRSIIPSSVVIIAFFLYSCSSTRRVPEDKYLLNRYKTENNNKDIDKNEVESYIRPKPNKRVLGLKFYLGLYNLSGTKDNWFNRWLKKIGEEPVIWNEFDIEKNKERVKLYLRNKGYYYAEVADTSRFHKQKAYVRYKIDTGEPYSINKVSYQFRDTTLRELILSDTMNTLLKRGSFFDADVIQEERTRIENYLKTLGFYNFNKDLINFEADTTLNNLTVDLTAVIDEYQLKKQEDYYINYVPNRKYRINNVYVLSDFNQKDALVDYQEYLKSLTESTFNNYMFLYHDRLKVDPDIITQSIYIIPGNLYNIDDVSQTYQHLSSLRIFKTVNIFFEEEDPENPYQQEDYPLKCYIQLTPATLQAYSFELEGTNSSGNFGAASNISYQHRNLFGGAENLNIRLKGSIEFLRKLDTTNIQNLKGIYLVYEAGIDARITLPQFLLPFRTENFIRKYNPKTRISLAFNQQQRPDYTRRFTNFGFGYTWSNFPYISHIINPININYVKMTNDSIFQNDIQGTYLQHSYEDRLITSTSYSFIFNNQDIKKLGSYTYFRINTEQSGFLLAGIYSLFGNSNRNGNYELAGNEFAQFIKCDFDIRHYSIVDDKTSFMYRFFAGVAWPYGNSIAIPFEKQYFTGGANGIRAWPVRNLGPGTYLDTISLFPNSTADIKMEANFEYRFKLFWILEGALFLDAGNIWAISDKDGRAGSVFKWNSFYKDIAIGTGLGLRMNFSFFIFRADLGLKVRDPIIPNGPQWVLFDQPDYYYKRADGTAIDYRFWQLHVAIGYPF